MVLKQTLASGTYPIPTSQADQLPLSNRREAQPSRSETIGTYRDKTSEGLADEYREEEDARANSGVAKGYLEELRDVK